jgi:bacteriorhodopsin
MLQAENKKGQSGADSLLNVWLVGMLLFNLAMSFSCAYYIQDMLSRPHPDIYIHGLINCWTSSFFSSNSLPTDEMTTDKAVQWNVLAVIGGICNCVFAIALLKRVRWGLYGFGVCGVISLISDMLLGGGREQVMQHAAGVVGGLLVLSLLLWNTGFLKPIKCLQKNIL